MQTPFTNAVSDSLERCRNAFHRILESEGNAPGVEPVGGEQVGEEEEDFLEVAARNAEIEQDPDPAAGGGNEPNNGQSDIENAFDECVRGYVENGECADESAFSLVKVKRVEGSPVEKYTIELSASGDTGMIDKIVSDMERILGGKYEFVTTGVYASDSTDGVATVANLEATATDNISESRCFRPFKQKRMRPRKPMQIRKAGKFVRNNKAMSRLFRRKYFAKRKLLFGD